jgi:FAD/FMN-containing dehydrogenase
MKRRALLQSAVGMAALWPTRSLLAQVAAAGGKLAAKTLTGGATTLALADVEALAGGLRGRLILPGQADYEGARRVWNAMIDRRPALIARCAAPSDVIQVVNFARERHLLTAVRCGGHSQTGKSTCDGGIVIDLSPMQSVRVDPAARLARVEGGALLRHLDRETRAFGLVTTAGTVSHTGVGGLTLGGGLGRVARRFGLACDNLRSVDVVTAAGKLVTASETENADLLWGLRGGGGNFGVATSFEFALHPMDPMVLSGDLAWPYERAREVMRFYADFSANAPDELNIDLSTIRTPDGRMMIGSEVVWSADHAAGERVLKPLRSFGPPAIDTVRAVPYTEVQAQHDKFLENGIRDYRKSGFLLSIDENTIDALLETLRAAPPGLVRMTFQQSGGAIGRRAVDATAFPNRDSRYWVALASSFKDPAEDEARIAAVRTAWKPIEPLTRGFYVNAMTEDMYAKVDANYGSNYARLAQLKRKYDPGNLFRLNANVVPAASS